VIRMKLLLVHESATWSVLTIQTVVTPMGKRAITAGIQYLILHLRRPMSASTTTVYSREKLICSPTWRGGAVSDSAPPLGAAIRCGSDRVGWFSVQGVGVGLGKPVAEAADGGTQEWYGSCDHNAGGGGRLRAALRKRLIERINAFTRT